MRSRLAGVRGSITSADVERKRPAVIVAHGMWESKESVEPLVRALEGRGWLSVAIDMRGHGERRGKWHDLGTAGVRAKGAKWFMNLVARLSLESARDIAAVADELRAQEDVDSNRLALWGNSLGCQAVLAAIPLVAPRVAVAGWGNADWDLMWRLSWAEFHTDKPMPEPQWSPTVARLIAELDPVHRAPEFPPTALLAMHGEDDHPMVDGMLSLWRRLEPAYASEPERIELRLFAGGHQWSTEATGAGLEWLARWL